MKALALIVMPQEFSVVRLPADAAVPGWAQDGALYSITRSDEELSLLCESRLVSPDLPCETGWRALKVRGPLDFGETGILAGIAEVLARDRISIFALSTYDTDYILTKNDQLRQAVFTLSDAGYSVEE